MKTYKYLVFFALMVFEICYAGRGYAQNSRQPSVNLDVVEKRIQDNPDSCLKVLLKFHPHEINIRAKVICLTGNCWFYAKQPDSALKHYQKARSLVNGIPELQPGLYYHMAGAYFEKSDYEQAARWYLKALKLLENSTDKKLVILANNDLGILYYERNRADSAILFYQQSLKYATAIHDTNTMAMTINNISLAYNRIGNYEKAIEWQLNAIKLKEHLNDTLSLATSLNNVGALFMKVKKYADANRHLKRAFALLALKKNGKIKGFSALNLGISFKMLKQYDSAIDYYNKALKIYTDAGLEEKKGSVYTNLGALYEALNQYDQALVYMLKALSLSRMLNKQTEVAIRSRNIANLYLLMHKPALARDYILNAMKISARVGSLELNKDVYNTLAGYYEQTGNFREALKWQKEYSRMNDSLYSENSQKTINELNTKYETEIKEKEILSLQKQQRIIDLELKQKENTLFQQRLILLFTLIIVTLIALISYMGFHRYKLKQRNARELLSRQKAELEQRMLLAQMNPHFIFNSLNSVQNFIGTNQSGLARQFLAKFARLMRLILENSRRQFVPLDEEVNALTLYLELEKQRHHDRFTFAIEVEIEEPEFVLIPPMLVQPFVENAIIHGFTPEKTGLVKVIYSMENDLITCLIEDNGKGRTPNENAGHPQTSHHSIGSSVVAERIDLLKKEFNVNASITYTDLKNENGSPAGTRVTLQLPFMERNN